MSTEIYTAIRAFIIELAHPPLEPEFVAQGWQNRAALPPQTNDYAVIAVIGETRRGTAVETLTEGAEPDGPGRMSVSALNLIRAEIDFFSEDDKARQRAGSVATVFRSSIGDAFFKTFGFSALYAGDPVDKSFVDESRQFVRRWAVPINVGAVSEVIAPCEFFDNVSVARLENVEVHHPGQGGCPAPPVAHATGPNTLTLVSKATAPDCSEA